jgi:hypothetical protein
MFGYNGYIKSKPTATNFVIYLDSIAPLVYSQRQVDAIYFDFSNAFNAVPHELIPRKLNDCGLSCRLHKLVPQLVDQQSISCPLPWSTVFTIWSVT